MGQLKDLTGKRFNRIKVVERVPNKTISGKTRVYWKCACDCGTIKEISGDSLRNGSTQSCGCLNSENLVGSARNYKHGLASHPIHIVWSNMKTRCVNTKNRAYPYYGGRGISICDEWFNDVEAFFRYTTSIGWEQGLEMHRPDNDGDYEPGNIVFITKEEHAKIHNNVSKHRRE